MKPFTFALLLLAQRIDDALRAEQLRSRPNALALALLKLRKQRLSRRFSQSLLPLAAGR